MLHPYNGGNYCRLIIKSTEYLLRFGFWYFLLVLLYLDSGDISLSWCDNKDLIEKHAFSICFHKQNWIVFGWSIDRSRCRWMCQETSSNVQTYSVYIVVHQPALTLKCVCVCVCTVCLNGCASVYGFLTDWHICARSSAYVRAPFAICVRACLHKLPFLVFFKVPSHLRDRLWVMSQRLASNPVNGWWID